MNGYKRLVVLLAAATVVAAGCSGSEGKTPIETAILANADGSHTSVVLRNVERSQAVASTTYRFDLEVNGALHAVEVAVADGTLHAVSHAKNQEVAIDVDTSDSFRRMQTSYTRDGLTRTLAAVTSDGSGLGATAVAGFDVARVYGMPIADQGVHRELLWALSALQRRGELALTPGMTAAMVQTDMIDHYYSSTHEAAPSMQQQSKNLHLVGAPALPLDDPTCYGDCSQSHISSYEAQVAKAVVGVPGIVIASVNAPFVKGSSKCFGTCEVESGTTGSLRDYTYDNNAGNNACQTAGWKKPDYDKYYVLSGECEAKATNPTGCITDNIQDQSRAFASTVTVWGVKVLDFKLSNNDCNLSQTINAKLSSNVISCFNSTRNLQQTVSQTWSFTGGCDGNNSNPCSE